MQYQDGHISTCFNKKVLVIYILYRCLCQLVIIRDLFICALYLLLVIHLFCSLFDYLFCFHSHRFFACLLFKRKRNNSDPEPCSGISILYPCTCSSIQHHHFESINIIQQTPPTLSQYRSEGPITIIDITGQTKPIFPKQTISAEGETVNLL